MRIKRLTPRRPAQLQRLWGVCSMLLDYPTQELLDSLDDLQGLAAGHPALDPVFAHLRRTPLIDLQREYVETFDHSRKCALYLTYYAYGDTRRRGAALLAFKHAYLEAGAEWDDETGELPDHLCAVLQFGATVDPDVAWRLLNDHRAGLELLRLALASWRRTGGGVGSPWLGVLQALCDALPVLAGDEEAAVRRLIAQGPPAEEVGLAPYGTDPIIATTIPVGAPR